MLKHTFFVVNADDDGLTDIIDANFPCTPLEQKNPNLSRSRDICASLNGDLIL